MLRHLGLDRLCCWAGGAAAADGSPAHLPQCPDGIAVGSGHAGAAFRVRGADPSVLCGDLIYKCFVNACCRKGIIVVLQLQRRYRIKSAVATIGPAPVK